MSVDRFSPGLYFDYNEYIDIIVTAKDGGNVFRRDLLALINVVNDYITNEISVPYNFTNRPGYFKYADLCMSLDGKCYLNDHLKLFANFEEVVAKQLSHRTNESTFAKGLFESAVEHLRNEIVLTYPIGFNGRTPVNFGGLVSAVHLNGSDNTIVSANATRLLYDLRMDITWVGQEVIHYKPYRLVFFFSATCCLS
jgi:hypothetical protein